jgi:hypothetical protein
MPGLGLEKAQDKISNGAMRSFLETFPKYQKVPSFFIKKMYFFCK